MYAITCTGCLTVKAEEDFYPSTLRGDCSNRCKDCYRESARRTRAARGVTPRRVLSRTNEFRECGRCGEIKTYVDYYPSQWAAHSPWCRACRAAYQRERQQEPGFSYRSKNSGRVRNRLWFEALKARSKCAECGYDHPAALDWHHKDPSTKTFSIAWGVANLATIANLEAEAEKCIVLCANCHRKYHWAHRKNRRAKQAADQEK